VKYIFVLLMIVCLPALASAQSYYRYPGNGLTVTNSVSPELQIQYNDRGLQYVSNKRLNKSEQHLIALGAPQSQIKKLMNFPQRDYGQWVERSYRSALSQFTECGGSVAAAASTFNPASVFVMFEPAPFTDTNLPDQRLLAGAFLPAMHQIRALAFYKSEMNGELAYLPSVMTSEWGNAIANHIGIPGSPGTRIGPASKPGGKVRQV
jgi:hypothetical protein